MAITISVNHKALPLGTMIELSRVCAVPNGGSVTLTKEQEAKFYSRFPDGTLSEPFALDIDGAPPATVNETPDTDENEEGGEVT